jgi:type IV secretion system protein TrbL
VGTRIADAFNERIAVGRNAAWRATGGSTGGNNPSPASGGEAAPHDPAPEWARRLRAEQVRRAHLQSTAQAVKEGDRASGEANPNLGQQEE